MLLLHGFTPASKKYVARDIKRDRETRLYETRARTATMGIDPEANEPILHIGGHIIRAEVEKALKQYP